MTPSAKHILAIALIICTLPSISQEISQSLSLSGIAEELASEGNDPESASMFLSKLQELTDDRVKINSGSETELARLFFLSDFQIKAILDYTKNAGPLLTVYEIAVIPGFDKNIAEMLSRFISLEMDDGHSSDSVRFRSNLLTGISFRNSSDDSLSIGPANKLLLRYRFTAGAVTGNLTCEKDYGEKYLSGTPAAPEYIVAGLAYSGKKVIRKIVAGDFSARFGAGTNVNTGLRRGLSLLSAMTLSASNEIKQYSSTDENRALRGIAATIGFSDFQFTGFASAKRSDATLLSQSGVSLDSFESFYTAGLHNTYLLRNKKDAVTLTSLGLAASYDIKNMKIGAAFSSTGLSLPVAADTTDLSKIFSFTGNQLYISTAYYNLIIKNILLSGEISYTSTHSRAIVQSVSMRPSPRLNLSVFLRCYDRGYISFLGSGPGSGSKNSNEKGISTRFTLEAAKHLFIDAGVDLTVYPWLKYLLSSPSQSVRKEIRIRYLPSENISLNLNFSSRKTGADADVTTGIAPLNYKTSRTFRISLHYSPAKNISIATTAALVASGPQKNKGSVLSQDLSFAFRSVPLTVSARLCIYNTSNWDSRIYLYENDLLYSYSVPALSGKGIRQYLILMWKPGDKFDLRLRYSSSIKQDDNVSLTPLREIKIQTRFWF